MDKKKKTRVSVTLTDLYLEKLDHLVEEGLFLTYGDILRDAIRMIFRYYKIEPFYREVSEVEGESEKGSERTGSG